MIEPTGSNQNRYVNQNQLQLLGLTIVAKDVHVFYFFKTLKFKIILIFQSIEEACEVFLLQNLNSIKFRNNVEV